VSARRKVVPAGLVLSQWTAQPTRNFSPELGSSLLCCCHFALWSQLDIVLFLFVLSFPLCNSFMLFRFNYFIDFLILCVHLISSSASVHAFFKMQFRNLPDWLTNRPTDWPTGLRNVRPNRGPHILGAHTFAKNFMRSKLSVSTSKENMSKQTSRKYALLYTQVSRVQTWENFLVFTVRQIHLQNSQDLAYI